MSLRICSSYVGGSIPVCCVPGSTEKGTIDECFSLLNSYRVSQGKAAPAYDNNLQASVEGPCHHVSVYPFFSHFVPEAVVRNFAKRASECGTAASCAAFFIE